MPINRADERRQLKDESQVRDESVTPLCPLTTTFIALVIMLIIAGVIGICLHYYGDDADDTSVNEDNFDKLLNGDDLTEEEKKEMFIWLSDKVTKYVPPNIRAKMEDGSDFDISHLVISDNQLSKMTISFCGLTESEKSDATEPLLKGFAELLNVDPSKVSMEWAITGECDHGRRRLLGHEGGRRHSTTFRAVGSTTAPSLSPTIAPSKSPTSTPTGSPVTCIAASTWKCDDTNKNSIKNAVSHADHKVVTNLGSGDPVQQVGICKNHCQEMCNCVGFSFQRASKGGEDCWFYVDPASKSITNWEYNPAYVTPPSTVCFMQ